MDGSVKNRIRYGVFQDWKANRGNSKGRVVLCFFRLAVLVRSVKVFTLFFFWYLILYRLFVEWFLNIEIHWNVRAGEGLSLEHGHGTVVNGSAVLGKNCTLRHLTTIGNKKLPDGSFSQSPRLGDHVDIGAGVSIIGDITIGDHVVIGAGAVIIKSVPPHCVVAGNPARIIRKIETF